MTSLTYNYPSAGNIYSISQAYPAEVVMLIPAAQTAACTYRNGLYVRIVIPYPNSMPELNGSIFPITVVDANKFTIPVDTRNFTPFILPPIDPFTTTFVNFAQAIPVAESAFTLTSAQDVIGPNNPQ